MRFLFALVLLLCIAVCITNARRKNKKEWRQKKMDIMSRHQYIDHDFDDRNDIEKKHNRFNKSHKKSHTKDGSRWKKNKGKKGKFYSGDLSWVTVMDESDCKEKCNYGEVCIMGPIDSRHVCVHKKDLKKSVKMFHKYQKKEMKAWRKFKKQKYGHRQNMKDFDDMEKNKFALMKKEYMMKREGFDQEKARKHHADTHQSKAFDSDKRVKHHHKLGFADKEEHSKHQKMRKQMEDNYVEKPKTDLSLPMTPVEAGSSDECETSQFSQMRNRMMGWFHLLHGQDHLARQAHGGSLKHFYKHISVKKELREFNGDKCECLKSAMWQFHQMDKNVDDHLSPEELHVIEQDSFEPCLKPYITSCDRNGDSKLSSDEWCCCFANVVAPCFKKLDELRRAGDTDSYVPACDKEGYFMREQCNSQSNEMSCWCVDYNGNELYGTRTKGRAHCHKLALRAFKSGKLE